MYPENPEGNRVIVGSVNMGYDIFSVEGLTNTKPPSQAPQACSQALSYRFSSDNIVGFWDSDTCKKKISSLILNAVFLAKQLKLIFRIYHQ